MGPYNPATKLNNKAAKLVLNKPLNYSSATDALSQLGWLNLNQRRYFHRCLYVYKCVNGITSHKLELSRNRDVHKYNTRSKDHVRLPTVKRNWGKQRTCYHAFKDWNALDSDLKNSDTICQFKSNFFKSINLKFTSVFLIYIYFFNSCIYFFNDLVLFRFISVDHLRVRKLPVKKKISLIKEDG